MSIKTKTVYWAAVLTASGIMLQSLYFKFTAHPESVYIFSTLGMEPWGRIGIGVGEVIASALLLWPAVSVWGALLTIQLMSGAIYFHLTSLGIEVMGDRGQLFYMAMLTAACACMVAYMRKEVLLSLIHTYPIREKSKSREQILNRSLTHW